MPRQAGVLVNEDLLQDTPTLEGYEATGPEIAIAETMFLGLRLLEGMTLSDFQQRHDIDLLEVYGTEVDDLVAKGLLGF